SGEARKPKRGSEVSSPCAAELSDRNNAATMKLRIRQYMEVARAMRPELSFSQTTEGTMFIRLSGDWNLGNVLPSAAEVRKQIEVVPQMQRLSFDTKDLNAWDSGLLIFLTKVIDLCSQTGITVQKDGLPPGVQRLLDLATAVPERKGARKEAKRVPFFARVGESSVAFWQSAKEMISFIGEATIAFVRMLTGRARFRSHD